MKIQRIRIAFVAAFLPFLAASAAGAQAAAADLLTAPLEKRSFMVPKKAFQDAGTLTVSLPRGWTIKEDAADSYHLDGRIKVVDPKTKKEDTVWFYLWVSRADDEAAAQRLLKAAPPSDEKLAGSGEEKVGSWSARWVDAHEIKQSFQRHNYHWYFARGRNTMHIEFHVPMFCFNQVKPTLDAMARSVDFQVGAAPAPAKGSATKPTSPPTPAPKRP